MSDRGASRAGPGVVPPLAAATLAVTLVSLMAFVPLGRQQRADAAPTDCSANPPLGIAAQFGELVRTDSQRVSDAEGRVAVGHDLTVTGPFSVGTGTTTGFEGGSLDLVVGGTVSTPYGVIVAGGASFLEHSGSASLLDADPKLQQPPPFDVEEEFDRLRARADEWAGLAENGTTSILPFPTRAEMTGTDPTLNVFSITSADMSEITEWYLRVPTGATTLVNVEGAGTVDVQQLTSLLIWDEGSGRYVLDGTPSPPTGFAEVRARLLWNLPAATAIDKGPSSWPGTILAPRAAFHFGSGTAIGPGQVNGAVIVESMTSAAGATTNLVPFTGCLGTPLVVRKTIAGAAAGLQGDIVVEVTCDDGTTATWTIPAGSVDPPPFTLDGVPSGTVCTVTETADGGTGEIDVTTTPGPTQSVTVGDTDEVELTNTYTPRPVETRLVVDKRIAGSAAGQQGAATVWVTCTDGTQTTFDVAAGATAAQQFVVAPLPPATSCDVGEAPDGDTATVDVTTAGAGAVVTPAAGDVTATLTNTVEPRTGRLVVTSALTGNAVGLQEAITVDVDCDRGPTGVEHVVPTGATTPATFVVEPIPAGARCRVTAAGGSTGPVVVVADEPDPVLVTADRTASVTVTNTVTIGQLVVVTRLAGDSVLRSAITLAVDCGAGPSTFTVPPGQVPLPIAAPVTPGATCTVAETDTGENALVAAEVGGDLDPVSHAATVTVPLDSAPVVVEVLNRYTAIGGVLVVDTRVSGAAAGDRGPITIDVACTGGTVVTETFAPGDGVEPIVAAGLADGEVCAVAETATGATASVAVDVTMSTETVDPFLAPSAGIPSVPATIVAGRATIVSIDNVYRAVAPITVTTTVAGPAAALHGRIAVVVACPGGLVATGSLATGAGGPLVVSVPRVPVGAACLVAQPADGSTRTTDVVVSGLPGGAVTVAGGGTEVAIVDTYTAAPGSVTVTKRVTGPDRGARGEVSVEIACLTGGGIVRDGVTYAPAEPPTRLISRPLAAGSVCVVVETADGSSAHTEVSTAILPRALLQVAAGGGTTGCSSSTSTAPRRGG